MKQGPTVACPACGHPAGAGARYCEACGAPVVRRCPHCQAEVGASARFCASCGQPLETTAPETGEHRTVTILFADAVGSTPIAERLGEEEMYGLIQGCVARMVEAVRHYDGHVATFTGDGVMAVFGAPVAHEESERRAVSAALAMQRSLSEYGDRIGFRVGVNTGPVVVGKVTDELDMEVTAIGDTVNLAARIEQLAEAGAVYLTGSTYRGVADFFECEAVGPLQVKGRADPVPAWRVLREKPVRTRFELAAERGLAPFVGRDDELAMLEREFRRVRQVRGQVVFVSGEPGIGKSRLLLEFRRRLEGTEARWLEAHCISYGRSIPYLPFAGLLKQAFSIEEGDDEAAVVEHVEAATAGWDPAARATVPYLRYLLSVDPGDTRVAGMDPRERRAGITDGLRALLYQESARRPLVIAVEDLHWVDEPSERALVALIDVVAATSVLLVLTHRPGYSHAMDRTYSTRLALERLPEADSGALVKGVLGDADVPDEVQRLVAAQAEGNPFYTEEVLRSLLESGVLTRTKGSYALTRSLREVRIPETIQEVILSRIDRLERPAKGALQLASVIGREFTVRLLERISDLEARLEGALSQLKALEFIYEKAYFPELAYMFKHALTHDVAYSTLLSERRRALHRIVAAAIEQLYAERLVEQYETLAHHYHEAGVWEKALEYLDQAGRKAAAAYATQDALDYYARALEVCERLGETTLPLTASVAQRRAYVSFGIGRFPEAIADLDHTVAAARRLGDEPTEAIALAYRGYAELWNHQLEASEATLLDVIGRGEDELVGARALASLLLGILYTISHRHQEAEPLLAFVTAHADTLDSFGRGLWGWVGSRYELWQGRPDAALRLAAEGRPATEPFIAHRLFGMWNEAHALGTTGEYEAALRLLQNTLDACERVGDVVVRVRCLNTLGWVYAEIGELERALEWNRRGLDMARTIPAPNPEVEMNAALNLAENLLARGGLDEAEENFREVEQVVRDPGIVWMRWRYAQRFFHSFGEYWLARGDPDTALAYAGECLAVAEHSGSRKYIAKGRRLRGQAVLAGGRPDEAEADLVAALDVAAEVGNPPQLWRCHVAVGDLRRAQRRLEEARTAYADAVSVIDLVAANLTGEELRRTFLSWDHVQDIRRAASG